MVFTKYTVYKVCDVIRIIILQVMNIKISIGPSFIYPCHTVHFLMGKYLQI